MNKKTSKAAGFTMVEIMFVVLIISVITAIAIPNAQRMIINANEKAAISTIKGLQRAMEAYKDIFNKYPNSTAGNAQIKLVNATLLPAIFNFSPSRFHGYLARCNATETSFRCRVDPVTGWGGTGFYSYLCWNTDSQIYIFDPVTATMRPYRGN